MHVIATTAGQGKTSQLLEMLVKEQGIRLFVTSEDYPHVISSRISGGNHVFLNTVIRVPGTTTDMTICNYGTTGVINAVNADEVEKVIEWMELVQMKPTCVALDVNNVLKDQDWLNLSMKLEAAGFKVSGSQQIIRPAKRENIRVYPVHPVNMGRTLGEVILMGTGNASNK